MERDQRSKNSASSKLLLEKNFIPLTTIKGTKLDIIIRAQLSSRKSLYVEKKKIDKFEKFDISIFNYIVIKFKFKLN